jgi:hypothetical protein
MKGKFISGWAVPAFVGAMAALFAPDIESPRAHILPFDRGTIIALFGAAVAI